MCLSYMLSFPASLPLVNSAKFDELSEPSVSGSESVEFADLVFAPFSVGELVPSEVGVAFAISGVLDIVGAAGIVDLFVSRRDFELVVCSSAPIRLDFCTPSSKVVSLGDIHFFDRPEFCLVPFPG